MSSQLSNEMSTPPSRYASLSREELATVVPELLLIGQLIDRSGMAWCIQEFGRDGMVQVAIDEWAASSPVYTRRMQRALDFVGDDVITIFKGLQLDIGAPPQFMDFRYTIHDPFHGEFHLDHCGALMDVEPMGEDYVVGMCHVIEDPTFDATAVATNPRAQMRPLHRPPRSPSDRHPHCAWTVQIEDHYPEVEGTPNLAVIQETRAATWDLAPIDPTDDGAADYSGALMSDFDFAHFSHSALTRIADEVCLQMHLLTEAFALAVRQRTDEATARQIYTKQLVGISGVATERLHRALGLPATIEGALRAIELHPLLNPAGYVDADVDEQQLQVRRSAAHDDGAWISLLGPDETRPLQAALTAVDPYLRVQVAGTATEWTASVVRADEPAAEYPEVQVTRFSKGTTFEFQPRTSIPITPVH